MPTCPHCNGEPEDLDDGRAWCDHCRVVIPEATPACPVPFSRRRKDIDE